LQKSSIIRISRFLIAISLIVYILFFIELQNIISSFKKVNLIFFSSALLLLIPNLFFQFLKWKYLLNSTINFYDNKKIVRSLFVGLSSGIFTPMRLGEYYGRSLDINKSSLTEIAALTFIDKIFVLVSVVLIGGIFFVFFVSDFLHLNIIVKIGAYALIIIIPILPFLFIVFTKSNSAARFMQIKLLAKIAEKLSALKTVNHKILVITFFYSVVIYFIYTLQYSLLLTAFESDSLIQQNFIMSNVIMFSKALIPQISFGELGVRESTSVFYSSFFNISGAAAFNASILIFTINLLLPAIIGLFFITKKIR